MKMNTLKVNNTRNNGDNGCYGHGGRSTSQISVYDYPEHLNPFYEDENHKRIRFWHIGKSKKNKYSNDNNNNNNGASSRRGSFSFGEIKNMWAFKSFRLKKKSSTLGINKTSESPPPLRRLQDNENHYGTYDPRMRHTIGINNNFLRNVPYRASLQDMRSVQNVEHNNNNTNGLGFERNNRYRSTIQTTAAQRNRALTTKSDELSSPMAPPRRYVYGGSVTPQPRLRSNDIEDDYSGISRGSSQMSISSKNPFEEDEGNEDIIIRKITNSGSELNGKRHIKKKRRAPPPPIPIPKIINEESQIAINENSPNAVRNEEHVEIKNLTVEIENFVKSVNNCSEENSSIKDIGNNKISNDKSDENLIEKNINAKDIETTEDLSSLENNHPEKEKIETVETVITTITKPRFTISEKNTNNDDCTIEKENFTENLEQLKQDNTVELRTKEIKSQSTDNDFVNISSSDNFRPSETENSSEQISSEGTSQKPESNYNQTIELKITESVEDLSDLQKSETSNDVINEIVQLPLNNYREIKEINIDSKKISNENNEVQEQQEQPPVRRRSVREIIESINRSQKLLNVHQNSTSSVRNDEDFNNLNNNENDLNVKSNDQIKAPPRKKHDLKDQKFSQKQIESVQTDEINAIADREINKYNYENDENIIADEILEKLSDKINNDNKECEIFKKCEIKKVNTNTNRETSPTSSNLDWNPLPKPKRTKKLAVELQDNQNLIKNE